MSEFKGLTLSGVPEAETYIDATLKRMTRMVLNEIDRDKVRALVLLGGYGKGEGGVTKLAGKYRPHNNFDLMLLVKTLSESRRRELEKRLTRVLMNFSKTLTVGIDISVLSDRKFARMPTRVLWYDMRYGHKTLYGEESFVSAVNHDISGIPQWDVRDLMVNRGSLLLINLLCLRVKNRSEQHNRLIIKHTMKAIIGYGDALLFFLGNYHWSYREKHKILIKHPDVDLNFKRLYDEAILFRREPNYEFYLDQDLETWHASVLGRLQKIHLRCEALRLGEEHIEWDSYFKHALRHSLFDRGLHPVEMLKRARNLCLSHRGELPSELGLVERLAYRLADQQTILPLIFPYIVFETTLTQRDDYLVRFIQSHLNPASSDSKLDIARQYLRNWGEEFDRNLQSVLLKNQIAI